MMDAKAPAPGLDDASRILGRSRRYVEVVEDCDESGQEVAGVVDVPELVAEQQPGAEGGGASQAGRTLRGRLSAGWARRWRARAVSPFGESSRVRSDRQCPRAGVSGWRVDAAGDDPACVLCGGDRGVLREYLTAAPGEVPGVWSGRQAAGLGLSGEVTVEQLEALLSGRDPTTGIPLGRQLLDRYTSDGR